MSIALLDDHDVVRVGLRTVLESLGRFQIDLEAARGREFLWRASGLRLDAAIVDYQLGDMRGDEVCSRVRQMVPGRPDGRWAAAARTRLVQPVSPAAPDATRPHCGKVFKAPGPGEAERSGSELSQGPSWLTRPRADPQSLRSTFRRRAGSKHAPSSSLLSRSDVDG